MMRTNRIGAAILSLLVLTGCAQNTPQRSYPPGAIGSAMQVHRGEVLAISTVTVEGRHSPLGTWGGAVIGNSVGRTVGDRSGRRIAGAVGAVGGAVAGRAIERAATSRQAVEVIVQLDHGPVIAIIQEDPGSLHPGDRVRVLRGPRTNRVIPI